MTLGAEPKKVAILAVIVVAGIGYYLMSGDSSSPSPSAAPRVAANPNVIDPVDKSLSPTRTKSQPRAASAEFRPHVGGARPEDKIDPASIDPELRLDLLKKVQAIAPVEGGRNLFQFGAATAPDKTLPAVPSGVPKIPINQAVPKPPPTVTSLTPSGPPPAPPINLKYYGIAVSKGEGPKEAFLQDGDEVLVVHENEVVKKRYRIVKIAMNSIDIEDMQAKSTQTLKLQDIPG